MRLIGKVISYLLTAVLTIFLLYNLYSIGANHLFDMEHPTIFGYSAALVVSGSMEPAIKVNDLVVNHKEEIYRIGDVITFQKGENLVTHRIVDRTEEGFVTRGDKNNSNDKKAVSENNIVGKVVFIIPKTGLVIGYLKTPMGMCCVILWSILFVLYDKQSSEMKRLKKEKGEREDDELKKTENNHGK